MWARVAKGSSRSEKLRPMLRVGLLCILRKCGLFDGEHVEFLSSEGTVILIQKFFFFF